MKILMYADGFGVPTQTFITQDIKYLSQNHEILFICTIRNRDITIPNVTVKQIDIAQSFIQKVLWKLDLSLSFKNTSFTKEVAQLVTEFKPDIIHCQFGIEALRFIDNLENSDIPLTIQYRGYDASRLLHKKSYVKRLQDIMSRSNVSSIFVSYSLRQNLNRYNISTIPSMILHSGIDLSLFQRNQNTTSTIPFTFLQISSLKDKKGHIYTIKAFAKFLDTQPSKNYLLKLTGDGQEREALENLVKELHIKNYVEFVGFVSPAQARELLEKANVFVHHSITPNDGDEEGIPNALMEAMAMELPVISTYHAGIPELITDGIHGYLVEEKDINTYSKRMQDILTWNKLQTNRTRINQEFEINHHIQKLENFYVKIRN